MKDVRCVYSLYIITIDINGTAYWNEIANGAGKLKYNNSLHKCKQFNINTAWFQWNNST